MAKKKEEEVKKGLDEWMGTFSDMMTLLMCFFVMLFAMSSVDAAKFEAVANSFQSTFSIFKGGAQAIGDGILVSNGVSQLNQLDEYINSTGKTADSESDTVDFKEDIDVPVNHHRGRKNRGIFECLPVIDLRRHMHHFSKSLSRSVCKLIPHKYKTSLRIYRSLYRMKLFQLRF